jgi:alpha-L-fucosidase
VSSFLLALGSSFWQIKIMKSKLLACVLVATALSATFCSAEETKPQHDARMAWWREAKFGMFIHWGVYSVPAGFYNGKPVPGIGEWIMNG